MILFGVDEGLVALWIVILAFAVPLYVLPAYVAHMRNHPQTPAILVLTLLLGWTFFGWAIAMVWSSMQIPKGRPSPDEEEHPRKWYVKR